MHQYTVFFCYTDTPKYLLDCPIVRIGALDTPVPFAPVLEQVYLPNAQDIANAIRAQE